MSKPIQLGSRVRDTITGFEGIAMGRAEYLHECPAVQVQATELSDGKPMDKVWIDEPRLLVVSNGKPKCGFVEEKPCAS